MRLTNEELIYTYIINSTALNVMNRNLKKLPLRRYMIIAKQLSNLNHDYKKLMEIRNIKFHRDHLQSDDTFTYSIYENGWRRDTSIHKDEIKSAAEELIDTLLANVAELN